MIQNVRPNEQVIQNVRPNDVAGAHAGKKCVSPSFDTHTPSKKCAWEGKVMGSSWSTGNCVL